MSNTRFPSSSLTATLVAGALLYVPHAAAASECRGLAENTCGTEEACTWVRPYVRKDGREVRGHCKLARGKSKALTVTAVPSPGR